MANRTRALSALALAAAGALVLAGCSAGADPDGGAARTDVVIGLGAEPANLDFTTTDGAAIPQALLDNVYEGLVTLDDDGEIQPLLAESWEVSGDNTVYTFTLRDGVAFSNGDPFTADDAVWNIENVQSDAWTVSLKAAMDVVASAEAVDDTTLRVTLERPSNDWLFRMTTRIGAMFDPDAVDDLANVAVGTGPFTVADFTRGDSLELARNDDYWGDVPAVETVTFRYFDDVNAQNAALQSGDVDAAWALANLDSVAQFEGDDAFQVIEGGTNAEVVLSMNNAAGVFTDLRLRQAVNFAIDRETLIDNATAGYGQLIGSMVPPTDPWYDEALVDAYPFDPERAEALIAESGVEDPTIRFRYANLTNVQAAAQVVASDLEAVGFTVDLEPMEFPAQWLEQVFTNHDFDMSLVTHVEPRDITTYANPDYYWGYDDPTFQQLVADADAGTPEEQTADLRAAAALLSEQAVSDWLYLAPVVSVADAGLDGLPQNALGESLDVAGLAWR